MRTQTISAKLKLHYNKEQKDALRALAFAYRDALNFASKKAFELKKTSSANKIQKVTYQEIRERWDLPSTMVCGIARQVGATYKQLWTRLKNHIKNVKEKSKDGKVRKGKRYKGLNKAPKYTSPTAHLFYGKDYSWSKDQKISVATLNGRIKLSYSGYQKHLDLIKAGSHCGSAKLWQDKTTKQWYLIVSLELQKSDIDPASLKKVRGVDVGQRCLLVSSDTEGKVTFQHGGFVKHKCREFAKTRSGLQSKGTRSAKRVLGRLARRERRFKADVNHKLALSILENSIIIGMEDLTNCRERTFEKRRKGKNASEKQRVANRDHSSWSYAELANFVEYKAFFFDSMLLKVDPRNTSRKCSKCGFTSEENRPNGSLLFTCKACSRKVHSDKNGADNIKQKTLDIRQDLIFTGCLSITPKVSGNDGSLIRSHETNSQP